MDPGEAFRRLVDVMARLRAPDGCPWDREQTHQTLARHLLEETYETLEAIDAGSPEALREELGDLLLQIVFHAQIAGEAGAFDISDVADGLREKLVRRHPHVFGEMKVTGPGEVLANWEKQKRDEKGTGVMDGVPKAMPSLARASKLLGRAAQVGFEPPPSGNALLDLVAAARREGIEPESALRAAVDEFERRFRAVEKLAAADAKDLESLSPAEWGEYWERAQKGRQ